MLGLTTGNVQQFRSKLKGVGYTTTPLSDNGHITTLKIDGILHRSRCLNWTSFSGERNPWIFVANFVPKFRVQPRTVAILLRSESVANNCIGISAMSIDFTSVSFTIRIDTFHNQPSIRSHGTFTHRVCASLVRRVRWGYEPMLEIRDRFVSLLRLTRSWGRIMPGKGGQLTIGCGIKWMTHGTIMWSVASWRDSDGKSTIHSSFGTM